MIIKIKLFPEREGFCRKYLMYPLESVGLELPFGAFAPMYSTQSMYEVRYDTVCFTEEYWIFVWAGP